MGKLERRMHTRHVVFDSDVVLLGIHFYCTSFHASVIIFISGYFRGKFVMSDWHNFMDFAFVFFSNWNAWTEKVLLGFDCKWPLPSTKLSNGPWLRRLLWFTTQNNELQVKYTLLFSERYLKSFETGNESCQQSVKEREREREMLAFL